MNEINLLRRRWQLINPYPLSEYSFAVNEILTDGGDRYAYGTNLNNKLRIEIIEKCTANFIEKSWWEDRAVEDMPEFIKLKTNDGIIVFKFKPQTYLDKEFMQWRFGGNTISSFMPSTESEYLTYKNQTK